VFIQQSFNRYLQPQRRFQPFGLIGGKEEWGEGWGGGRGAGSKVEIRGEGMAIGRA